MKNEIKSLGFQNNWLIESTVFIHQTFSITGNSAGIYLLKVTIETLEQGVKYVQS